MGKGQKAHGARSSDYVDKDSDVFASCLSFGWCLAATSLYFGAHLIKTFMRELSELLQKVSKAIGYMFLKMEGGSLRQISGNVSFTITTIQKFKHSTYSMITSCVPRKSILIISKIKLLGGKK